MPLGEKIKNIVFSLFDTIEYIHSRRNGQTLNAYKSCLSLPARLEGYPVRFFFKRLNYYKF
jgi:hypothetical protein